jgi:hypothetical protein
MRAYLGSGVLQSAVADFFAQEKPVGAICHGVLLAARSSLDSGKSVLYGKKTTALTKQMELIAWRRTRLYLGDYYRLSQPLTGRAPRSLALGSPGFAEAPCTVCRFGLQFGIRTGIFYTGSEIANFPRLFTAYCFTVKRAKRLNLHDRATFFSERMTTHPWSACAFC